MMSIEGMSSGPSEAKAVWDPLVRLFHWSLAAFFFLAYFLENDWIALHVHAGYTVAMLVGFRVFWGFAGESHARFADFLTSPARSVRYLWLLLRGRAQAYPGHDPAGGMMIAVLLVSLLITAGSGMSLFAMEGSGPLANTFVATLRQEPVVSLHHFSADFTMALVVVHIAGVLLASFSLRENLIAAMFTGRKVRGAEEADVAVRAGADQASARQQ